MNFRTVIAAVCIFAFAPLVSAEVITFYIATSTGATSPSQGIYRSTLDTATGKLSDPVLATKAESTAFLAIHPSGNYLYTVGTSAQPAAGGAGAQPVSAASTQPAASAASTQPGTVTAYAIDKATGNLKLINTQSSGGTNPNHLSIDHTGKILLNSNYGSGSVQTLSIQANGGLGKQISFVQHTGSSVNPDRQAGPHAHCIYASPDNKYVYCTDLGLDKVMMYKMSSSGKLTANKPAFVQTKAGIGPRHFIFHPNGKFLYVINEIEGSVTGYSYKASNGALTEIQTISTFPEGYTGTTSSAEICITPNGKFLYGSNRGNNTIAAFKIDQTTGKLTLIEYESASLNSPGHIIIDPTGAFVIAANRNGNSITADRINQETGALDLAGPYILVPSPSCTVFAR